MCSKFGIENKIFRIVSDQAKNVKKAFASSTECVDVVDIAQALLNRQKKIDIIELQKKKKQEREDLLAKKNEEELINEIEEMNAVGREDKNNVKLTKDQILLEWDEDEELTTEQDNIDDIIDNTFDDAEAYVSDSDGDCLNQLDLDYEEFGTSN